MLQGKIHGINGINAMIQPISFCLHEVVSMDMNLEIVNHRFFTTDYV